MGRTGKYMWEVRKQETMGKSESMVNESKSRMDRRDMDRITRRLRILLILAKSTTRSSLRSN